MKVMSFFNLTQLGPQNPFHSVKKDSETPSEPGSNSKDLITLPGTVGPSYSQPPPSFTSQMYGNTSRDTSDTAATTTRRGGHALPHQGSHAKLSQMRIKHQRSEDGPIDMYQHPVASSQAYGWWIKESGYSPKWAQGERHVQVNSEMTRYVNEMSLTNKDFSLF